MYRAVNPVSKLCGKNFLREKEQEVNKSDFAQKRYHTSLMTSSPVSVLLLPSCLSHKTSSQKIHQVFPV